MGMNPITSFLLEDNFMRQWESTLTLEQVLMTKGNGYHLLELELELRGANLSRRKKIL